MKVKNHSTTIKMTSRLGLVLPLLILVGGGCKKSMLENNTSKLPLATTISTDSSLLDSFLVSSELAQVIAGRLAPNYMYNSTTMLLPNSNASRSIANWFPIGFEGESLPAAYVINYSGNSGYVIMSADYRNDPILSYSNHGNLLENDTLPEMIYEWLGYNAENVYALKSTSTSDNFEYAISRIKRWANIFENLDLDLPGIDDDGFVKPFDPRNYDPDLPGSKPCHDLTYRSKLNLINTSWGQGVTYNDLINAGITCANYANGKPPTGSTITAVAQLLKYWNKPNTSFNYSLMPNQAGNVHTQELMRSLGVSFNADYTCDETYANFMDIPVVLNTQFGYVSGGLANPYSLSNRLEIFDELDVDRLVPMGGMTDVTTPVYATRRNFWGVRREVQIGTLTQYKYWTWLIDGYFSYGTTCERITYFSINWGHDDSYLNNYYLESETRPQWQGAYAYLQNRKFIKYLFPQ